MSLVPNVLCAAGSIGVTKTLNHLGVFAKYWQPGRVKTRLAASIGSENAAVLFQRFVKQTLVRHRHSGDQRSIWIWPHEREPEFREFAPAEWTVRLQSDGDLGQRMNAYFESFLSQKNNSGNEQVVLIGTDSPSLPSSIIEDAFAALQDHDCVIGPSQDGGYYLIGMNRPIPELFQDMPWSSDQVLPNTLKRLQSLAFSCHQLPIWNDIDDIDDLKHLQQQLQLACGPKSQNPLDAELLQAIAESLS